jgi:Fe-S cluster assembly protein SufD
VLIKGVDEHHQLDFLTLGEQAKVEVIVYSKYKKAGDYLTTIKQKKYGDSRYNYITNSKVETTQNMNFILEEMAGLEVAILDFDAANKQARYTTKLTAEGTKIDFSQAILVTGKQHKKIIVDQHCRANDTQAVMNNYGVAFDQSQLQLEGTGRIDQGAKSTINQQQTHLLVLGNHARATTRPLLYIEENDVQAGHGMTMGKMDEEVLFYLLSRGLSEVDAKRFIVLGAFKPVIDKISDKKIRQNMLRYVQGVM